MAAILYDVKSQCALIRINELKIWVHLFLMLIPYTRAVPKIMFHCFSFTANVKIILTCSALQNTLHLPEYTFLAGQSTFGSSFATLQWGHPSDTDKPQIKGNFLNVSLSRQMIFEFWKQKIVAGSQVWQKWRMW